MSKMASGFKCLRLLFLLIRSILTCILKLFAWIFTVSSKLRFDEAAGIDYLLSDGHGTAVTDRLSGPSERFSAISSVRACSGIRNQAPSGMGFWQPVYAHDGRQDCRRLKTDRLASGEAAVAFPMGNSVGALCAKP